MTLEFNNPHALWLALLIPPYLYAMRRRVTSCAVRYPSVRNLKRLPRSVRQRCRFLLPLLHTIGLFLLVLVLARPLARIRSQEAPPLQGVGIMMLVDRSASMADPRNRMRYEGRLALRYDIAKDAFVRFVQGDGRKLKGRPNDLIGLCTFATYPQVDHPFSLDHSTLVDVMSKTSAEKPFLDAYGRPTDDVNQAAPVRDEYGRTVPRLNPMQMTAMKTAIEYAANKLILLDDDLSRASRLRKYDLKSKVLVLLTDGEPTAADARGNRDAPDEATIKMLTDANIRVYFIQILSKEHYVERPDGTVEVVVPGNDPFSAMRMSQMNALVNQNIEDARKLARRTGGEHYLATSGDDVRDVYARIDKLERSDVGGRTVFSHEEQYWYYLGAALAVFGAQALLGLTWLRRAP